VFKVGAVKTKQTPVRLTTQGNRRFRGEVFDLIEGKENGKGRAMNFEPYTNQLESFDKGPTIWVKLNMGDIEKPKY
jgi:hypothetical protein